MATSLKQQLQEELVEGGSDDDFVAKQLRRQIAAQRTGKSFIELYVTGRASPKLKLSEDS